MSGSLGTTSDQGGGTLFRSGEWRRAGRGRELQFFALDDELDEWVAEMKNLESGLLLAGFDLVEVERRKFAEMLFVCPSLKITDCRMDPGGTRRPNIWIVAERLTPRSLLGQASNQNDLAVNGLILVQPATERNGRFDASRISIVERIESTRTGEMRLHADYQRLFNGLSRRVKSQLTVKTRARRPNAPAGVPLMTARAAAAVAAGQVTFVRDPIEVE